MFEVVHKECRQFNSSLSWGNKWDDSHSYITQRFTDICFLEKCSPDKCSQDNCSLNKCSQDLILAREICQYGHRRYLTNYLYRTMHYSRKHGLAIAVLYCWRYVECSLSWLYTHRLRLGAGQVEHEGWWNLREWTNRHGQNRMGGKCRSGNIGTMCQKWTMQEWTYQHGMARVDNAESKVNAK